MSDISACILFFERSAQTLECIRSFASSGVPVHVLNNGSSLRATAAVKRELVAHPNVTLHASWRNIGVARGRNFLIEKTAEPWLLFVDSDITVEQPNWLEAMRCAIRAFPDAEVLVPSIFNRHEGQALNWMRLSTNGATVGLVPHDRDQPSNAFPGGAACVRRTLFDRLGTYDESLFVGFEDVELALRGHLADAPVTVRHVEGVTFIHDHRRAENRVDRRAARVRYRERDIRNSYDLLCRKHGIVLRSGWQSWIREQREAALC